MDNSELCSQAERPVGLAAQQIKKSIRSPVAVDNISDSLLARPQRIGWRYIECDGKQTKAPFSPHDIRFADSTSRAT